MKYSLHFGIGVWLVCAAFLFAQSSPSSTEQKQEPSASNLNTQEPKQPHKDKAGGPIEILSDSLGVDFGPYLQTVLKSVKQNWYNLIPESARAPLMKKGKVVIEFAILKDGRIGGMNLVEGFPRVAGMKLVESTGDVSLDRAAWAAITVSNPFSPLPAEFSGQYLALRFSFYYNAAPGDGEAQGTSSGIPAHTSTSRDKEQLAPPVLLRNPFPSGNPLSQGTATEQAARTAAMRTVPIDVQIPLGSFYVLTADMGYGIAAKGSTNPPLKWSIAGEGCSDAACGTLTDDLYKAPTVMPDPPVVTVKAISEIDDNVRAWVRIHLVAAVTHK